MTADSHPRPPRPSILRIAAWLCALAAVGVFFYAAWNRVHSTQSSQALVRAIGNGKRPVAPALPTARLAGVKNPGLPDGFANAAPAGGAAAKGSKAPIVVVNFLASWCGPCREEAPQLNDIASSGAERGVTVIGVNIGSEDAASDARDFVRDLKITYGIVRGTRADKERWGVSGFPETLVIGRDGRIGGRIPGPIDETTLTALIDREVART